MRIDNFHGAQESNERQPGYKKKKLDAAIKINTAIKTALDELEPQPKRQVAFLNLLTAVRAQTGLLKPTPGQGSTGWYAPIFLINRLKNLALRQCFWIRPLESWKGSRGSLREEFRSLAHHLCSIYPVPGFMDSVWDLPAGPDAFRQQAIFIRLGRGARMRSLNLPVAITREMEHHARRAPEHYTLIQALRYGETRGLGGSHKLSSAVADSRLGSDAANAPFWRTVLRFFAVHTDVPIRYVKPIIDFIQATKFAGEEFLAVNGTVTRTAAWPTFAIVGRTLNSLLRLVRVWNPELDCGSNNGYSWFQSGIQPFRYLEKSPAKLELEWSVVELLNSAALYAEGRAMRHCVYSYADKCRRRDSAIWSLRLRADNMEKRLVTIEVDPRHRTIVQMRASANRSPGVRSREIIRLWAAHAGLEYHPRA